MTNWVERLTGETRAALLAMLRRSRQTITTLADGLHLTDNAVRTRDRAQKLVATKVGTQADVRQ